MPVKTVLDGSAVPVRIWTDDIDEGSKAQLANIASLPFIHHHVAGVPDIIKRDAAARRGKPVDEDQLGFMKQMITEQINRESDPYFATARLWDDGILDPRQTRDALGIALSACATRPFTGTTSWGVIRH